MQQRQQTEEETLPVLPSEEQESEGGPTVDRTLSPEQETWLETLGVEMERQARSSRMYRHVAVGLLMALVGLTLITGFLTVDNGSPEMTRFFYLNLLGCVLASVGAMAIVTRQSRNRDISQIAELMDRRSVGLLLEAMEMSQDLWEYDNPARRGIKLALIRLLPQLQASDSDLLSEQQRSCLYRALHFSTDWKYPWHINTEFALAILKALEQIGDEKAIPYVERLAVGEGSAIREESVQQAAADCLPFLLAHRDHLEAQQTLLRASSSSAVSPAELLRASEQSLDVAPETLLRASTDGQNR